MSQANHQYEPRVSGSLTGESGNDLGAPRFTIRSSALESPRRDSDSDSAGRLALFALLSSILIATLLGSFHPTGPSIKSLQNPNGPELGWLHWPESRFAPAGPSTGIGVIDFEAEVLAARDRDLFVIRPNQDAGSWDPELWLLEENNVAPSRWEGREIPLSMAPRSLEIAERWLYVQGSVGRFPDPVIDRIQVLDAEHPERGALGQFDLGTHARAMHADRRFLYLLEGNDDLRVLEISDLGHIRDFSTLAFDGEDAFIPTVDVVGRGDGVAYVLLKKGIAIVDAREANALRDVGRIPGLEDPGGIWLLPGSGFLVALDRRWQGPGDIDLHLIVFELSDAFAPQRIAELVLEDVYDHENGLLGGGPGAKGQDGNLITLANIGMMTANFTDPYRPVLVASTILPERAERLVAGLRTIFVQHESEIRGIHVYRLVPIGRDDMGLLPRAWLPSLASRKRR